MRVSREVAGTFASSTGAPSIQFVAFVVNPVKTWVFNYQADPKTPYVTTATDGAVSEDMTTNTTDIETKVHTLERLTLLPRQTPILDFA